MQPYGDLAQNPLLLQLLAAALASAAAVLIVTLWWNGRAPQAPKSLRQTNPQFSPPVRSATVLACAAGGSKKLPSNISLLESLGISNSNKHTVEDKCHGPPATIPQPPNTAAAAAAPPAALDAGCSSCAAHEQCHQPAASSAARISNLQNAFSAPQTTSPSPLLRNPSPGVYERWLPPDAVPPGEPPPPIPSSLSTPELLPLQPPLGAAAASTFPCHAVSAQSLAPPLPPPLPTQHAPASRAARTSSRAHMHRPLSYVVAPPPLSAPTPLSTCVIREDAVYPPVDAEVTLEVREAIVRCGRKVLRYSVSRPLDTIYIKVPHVDPGQLPLPLLEGIARTIEVGSQRLVVGTSIRPGCIQLTLDLLRYPNANGPAPEPGQDPVPGPQAPGSIPLEWLDLLLQPVLEPVSASAGAAGGAGSLQQSQEAERQLSEVLGGWLEALGLQPTPGMVLKLQCKGRCNMATLEGSGNDGTGASRWRVAPCPDAATNHPAVLVDCGRHSQHDCVLSAPSHRVLLLPPEPGSVHLAVSIGMFGSGVGEGEGTGNGQPLAPVPAPANDVPPFLFVARCAGRALRVTAVPQAAPQPRSTVDAAAGDARADASADAGSQSRACRTWRWGLDVSALDACCAAGMPALLQVEVWLRDRIMASVPLLAVPAAHAELSSAIWQLLPASKGTGDDLILDLGQWCEYVAAHKVSREQQQRRALELQQQQQQQRQATHFPTSSVAYRGPEHAASTAEASEQVESVPDPNPIQQDLVPDPPALELLPGSADLSGVLQRMWLASAPHHETMLQAGAGLLRLAAGHGCRPLARFMLGGMSEAGFGADAVCAAAMAAAPLGVTLLHVAGCSGDVGVVELLAGALYGSGSVLASGDAVPDPARAGKTAADLLEEETAATGHQLAGGGCGGVDSADGDGGGLREREDGCAAPAECNWWRMVDGSGLTPLHYLAVAAPKAATDWAAARGGDIWAAWCHRGGPRVPAPAQMAAAPAAPPAAAAMRGSAAGAPQLELTSLTEASPFASAAAPLVAPAVGARRARGSPALRQVWLAVIAGFKPQEAERKYQLFQGVRTLKLARCWAMLHQCLLMAAVYRLLRDGRPQDVPAAVLYSSPYTAAMALLWASPVTYLRHRQRLWVACSALRSSAKLVQMLGWVCTPPSTRVFIEAGVTLVSDVALPAAFEQVALLPCLALRLYDVLLSAPFYLHTGCYGRHQVAVAVWNAIGKNLFALAINCVLEFAMRSTFMAGAGAGRESNGDGADGINGAPGIARKSS